MAAFLQILQSIYQHQFTEHLQVTCLSREEVHFTN